MALKGRGGRSTRPLFSMKVLKSKKKLCGGIISRGDFALHGGDILPRNCYEPNSQDLHCKENHIGSAVGNSLFYTETNRQTDIMLLLL